MAAFLGIRKLLDRSRERLGDMEIVREDMDEDDLHLGHWAQKNGNVLIQFRLKRDGRCNYDDIDLRKKDTVKHAGR